MLPANQYYAIFRLCPLMTFGSDASNIYWSSRSTCRDRSRESGSMT